MKSLDGEAVPLMTAREWCESHRLVLPAPSMLALGPVRPGWLDERTPCCCERVVIMHTKKAMSAEFVIEHLISRPRYSGGVFVYDPKGIGTKGH